MSLIDATYFISEISIPNTDQPAISSLIGTFITKYESKFLGIVLGYPLATDFITGLGAGDFVEQRWVDLKNGVTYIKDAKTFVCPGLANASTKESPIANYVYYWYMRNAITQTTSMGEQVTKIENSDPATIEFKVWRAWSEMLETVAAILDYVEFKKELYDFQKSKYEVLCELGTINPLGI